LFGVFRRREKYLFPFGDEKETTDFVKPIYDNFRQAMIDANTWGAFREIELAFVIIDWIQRVTFDEMK
jgi:hypothetical protein